jgi:arsenite-transporting ATPase
LSDGKTTGLIMAMGKGGVGKTLVASTIAVLLAQKGHKVLLTTTDPAAHIQEFISQLDLLPETLTIERIDPKVETSLYVDKIMQQKGATLDAEGKKLLYEDLQSPCTEEVAVFHAFSRAVHLGKRQFVVMDTAPTGHTLLLLDTAGSYHREVLRNTSLNPDRITTPYMSLQDSDFAKIVLVALPETTPIREAEALQNDLIRAGIQPFAWVMNQCLSLVEGLKDPILRKRGYSEQVLIESVRHDLTSRIYGIPFIAEEKLLPITARTQS